MNINTQLTSRAAVQDPSSGNAATSGFQCRETNQDYPLRAFSEVCLWEIPGLIQLVTEINPYSRWSTCSLSLGTWVQIPRAHKVRCCSVHLYPQCFCGELGGGDRRLLGSSGTSKRLCLKANGKREEMTGLSSDIHKVTWPAGSTQLLLWHSGISSHSWSASVSLLLPPTSFKTKPQTEKCISFQRSKLQIKT